MVKYAVVPDHGEPAPAPLSDRERRTLIHGSQGWLRVEYTRRGVVYRDGDDRAVTALVNRFTARGLIKNPARSRGRLSFELTPLAWYQLIPSGYERYFHQDQTCPRCAGSYGPLGEPGSTEAQPYYCLVCDFHSWDDAQDWPPVRPSWSDVKVWCVENGVTHDLDETRGFDLPGYTRHGLIRYTRKARARASVPARQVSR